MSAREWTLGLALAAALAAPTPAAAGLGVTARVGTPGLGVEVTKSIVPRINARGGFDWLGFDWETTQDGIDYDGRVSLKAFHLLADFHPIPLTGFRVSGGIVLNGNQVELESAPSAGEFQIGDEVFTAAQVGSLTGTADYGTVAPYLGIGWGNAARAGFGVSLDIGILFQGSPTVDLEASGIVASDPRFQAELEKEKADVEDDLGRYTRFYPVVTLGLSFGIPLI